MIKAILIYENGFFDFGINIISYLVIKIRIFIDNLNLIVKV